MYSLRHYQQEAVNRAVEFFESNQKTKPVLVLPTGSGKSIIIAHLVKALKGDVLILQPSKELLEQNYEKYEAVIKDHPELERASIFSASVGIKEIGKVTFATIGSIVNIPEQFAHVKYIIIDECHFVPPKKDSMYMKFLANINAQVIGLSATPYRLKSYTDFNGKKYSQINLLTREKPMFFNRFLYIVQPKQMLEEGFICPVRYIELNFDTSALRINSTGAEFTEKSIKEAVDRNKIIERIPGVLDQAYKKDRKSCLVFTRSVDEAKDLASKTPFSSSINALTPKKDREQILKQFKNGSTKTIFNVAVLTTGFDYPALDTVIVSRPTMSLALFTQMVGRAGRPSPNKEYSVVLDMCGNLKRFGRPEELVIEEDAVYGWVLRNDSKIISGRRLDQL